MRNHLLPLILIILLVFTPHICAENNNIANMQNTDIANTQLQNMTIMDEVGILATDLQTLRIMDTHTPLVVRGEDVEKLTVKLLSKYEGTGQIEFSYETLGEEIWLSAEMLIENIIKPQQKSDNVEVIEEGNADWTILEETSAEDARSQSQYSSDFFIEIVVPEHMSLVLGEAVYHADIAGIAGIDMNAGDGYFILADITGSVRIRDNSGTLMLKNITGDVWISDMGGLINVQDVTGLVTIDGEVGLTLKVQDVTGDVTISSKLGGCAEVANVQGNVSVFSRAPIKTACIDVTGNIIVPEN